MDFLTIGYYGVICALLAWTVPLLDKSFHRFLFGLCVGLIAATALPFLKVYFL